jgi:hypothetical protein
MRSLLAAAFSLSALVLPHTASAEPSKPKFPMPAAEFQSRASAHTEKARAHLEARIADKKIEAEKAKALRERFETAVAKTKLAIAKAVADGSVTREEAKEVRTVARANRHGHGHHRHHDDAQHGAQDDKHHESDK